MSDPLLTLANKPPPLFTSFPAEISVDNCRKLVILRSSSFKILEAIKVELSDLNEEYTLFVRFLSRIHNRFRNDKGYKDLRMVEKTLRKFLMHDFLGIVEEYTNFLPVITSSSPNIPSKQLLKYALAMVYGAGAFLNRTDSLLLNSGLLAVQRLNLGHFWGVGAQELACISRFWAVSRSLLKSVGDLYLMLFSRTVDVVPGVDPLFLEHFPLDLAKFLPEGFVVKTESILVDKFKDEQTTVNNFLDLGEPIKRVEMDKLLGIAEPGVDSVVCKPKESGMSVTKSKEVLNDIHSFEDLKEFLSKETVKRKVCRKLSLTRSLNQEDWKKLKKSLLENFNHKIPNKSLKLSRKSIRDALASIGQP